MRFLYFGDRETIEVDGNLVELVPGGFVDLPADDEIVQLLAQSSNLIPQVAAVQVEAVVE